MNAGRRRSALALPASAVLAAVLLTGCSDAGLPKATGNAPGGPGGTDAGSTPVATASPSTSASAAPVAKWAVPSDRRRFRKADRITGSLTPKSVDASADGFVVAQNMIYTHTVSVFGPDHDLVTTIKDQITPSNFGYPQWKKPVRGGPVEASFSPDGAYVWVSNYSTYGPGFSKEGHDVCSPSSGYDRSFLYRINTSDWTIDARSSRSPIRGLNL